MLCNGLPLHDLLLDPVRRLVVRRLVGNHDYPLCGKYAGTDLAREELHSVQSPRSDCVLSNGEIFQATEVAGNAPFAIRSLVGINNRPSPGALSLPTARAVALMSSPWLAAVR